jgi:hypothetical protein
MLEGRVDAAVCGFRSMRLPGPVEEKASVSAILSWVWPGVGGRAAALRRASLPLLFGALVLAASWVILATPREPVWDQLALLEASFRAPHHPSPARGFTSELLVAIYRAAWGGEGAAQNAGLRLIAMLLYTVSAALLARALLRRRASVALFLCLLFSSQYPFLWLSSELVTGAFLMAAICAWTLGASPWLVGALLALLGLCKPDVIVVALALLAYWTHRRSGREEGVALAVGFALCLGALLLPGWLLAGADYFRTYGGSGGRSFASFSQHYAALIAHLQIAAAPPNPWSDPAAYVQRHFPGARSMADVVIGHFPRYLEFVALSTVRGLFRAGYVVNYAALAVPCLAWGWRRGGFALGDRERTLLLSFIGFVPFVLFSYPHVRYMARYYPIFLLLLLSAFERVLAIEDRALRRPVLLGSGLCLGVSLLENLRRLGEALAHLDQLGQYWFPD